MPPAKKSASAEPVAPSWTPDQLRAVKHLGPAIIGEAMHAAAQALAAVPGQGVLGPAILDPDYAAKQAAARKTTAE